MNALKFIAIGLVLLFSSAVHAQVAVNVNIGAPPLWGPAGYSDVRYYYLPDVEAYYDIQSSKFVYYSGRTWVHRTYLPTRYRNYDLYNGYKVVMTDYRGDAPYTYYKEHRAKYSKGYKGGAQRTIGERPGRGNSGDRMSHDGNRGNRGEGRGMGKSDGHGNDKNMNRGHGKDGGNGKDRGNGKRK